MAFKGKGLHTGVDISMTIKPAQEDHGIVFSRVDLDGAPKVKALADFVVDTSRGTTIASGEARVSTIEHLMAALWGCGVDNALIEVNAPEVPILDGSAIIYAEEIEKAGTIEQNAERAYYRPDKHISYSNGNGIEIDIYPDERFSANVNVDFNSKVVGRQYAMFANGESEFKCNIAPCRTFVFLHEIKPLIDHNLIKGGDLDNAIVIVEQPIPAEEVKKLSEIFGRKDVPVNGTGYLNTEPLRHENEIARHKMLDLLGDLALIGARLEGRIIALRPGHHANTEFAKVVRKQMKADAGKPKYKYDPNKEPLYDINKIKATLPHRPPFLLVDKIIHLTDDTVVGIKNVTMNEPFFVGHFPDEPVMPGVLVVEAMAQCGGILALNTVPDPENYSTYFLKIDGVRFKHKIVPGDTLMFVLELSEPIRRGIVAMRAKAYIGDTLATEADLMAQIVKNRN
ncbi:MAG: bifunctional UDP-3-O-[3-hydroxymyristoyl] N-acetylglucosamine deacetylase/3-hydroxyacyl-ACP dehydratase [Rikenellaceae bacterium]|nr:bifunctional UDP-3-O-[3-hydroxymyristoyl] N-acetylglucosamine deacetylase/3-hydroxyacyl-ACP dehydratase [Rikenellaceae bacterium]